MKRNGRKGRWIGSAAGLLVLMLPWPVVARAETATASSLERTGANAVQPEGGAAGKTQLEEAEELLAHREYKAAVEAFWRANEAEDRRCGECVLGMARALRWLSPQDAVIAARKAVALLEGSALAGRAYCELGDHLLLRLLRRDAEAAAEAEAAYGKALETAGSQPGNLIGGAGSPPGAVDRAEALAGIARARLRRGHDAEAVKAADQALQADSTGKFLGSIRSTICQARRHLAGASDRSASAPQGSRAAASPPGDGSGAAADLDEPARVGDAVTRPTKVFGDAPAYTEQARKEHIQGVVIVEAVLDKDGCVVADHVLKGLPLGLDQAVLEALETWVFDPARREGKPVKVYYTLTANFQVQAPLPPSGPTN